MYATRTGRRAMESAFIVLRLLELIETDAMTEELAPEDNMPEAAILRPAISEAYYNIDNVLCKDS